jgi:FixJ family two-component response regulator
MISVVDDDEFVRQATANLLNSYGFDVATFASAEDFLASECADDTQCLITDVQMPGIGGLDLQQHLVRRGKAVPIILITAFPSEKIRAQAIELGAAGFFAKPYAEISLIECVKRALNKGPLA